MAPEKDHHDYMSFEDDSERSMLQFPTLTEGPTYYGSSSSSRRHHKSAIIYDHHRRAQHVDHHRHSSSTSARHPHHSAKAHEPFSRMRRIFTDNLLRAQEGTMFHLHRQGVYMTRVHMHMSLHQGTLRTVTDIHPRGIAIAIVHLMIVIDTATVMPQGEQLHKRQGRRHMRRPPMVIHQDTRWWQVNIKRTLIIWSLPLLMPPP